MCRYILKKIDQRKYFFLTVIIFISGVPLFGQSVNDSAVNRSREQDTTEVAVNLDSIVRTNGERVLADRHDPIQAEANRIQLGNIENLPFQTLQQQLKGNVAGAYVQETSGEPGSAQYIWIRGLSSPQLSAKDIASTQPTIYLNGIPLVKDNPFTYNIQHSDVVPIGPATNLLASIGSSEIASIEVIKDPALLAKLGPLAANGAIWVTTKNAHSGKREIFVNSYFGIAEKPSVTPTNAAWENQFRQPYYEKYGTIADQLNYPTFLKDSSDLNYYGPANWGDAYYKSALVHSVDLSLTGGTERANFRVAANNAHTSGVGDGTGLDRYGLSFYINMAPLPWLTVSAMMNGHRLQRTRNKNIRDRISEIGYIPDLSNPLPPNKAIYKDVYLGYFDNNQSIDDNKNNVLQGYISAAANFRNLKMSSRIAFDYNEGIRDVFWPSTLLEGNNYLSNYFGYNQRFMVENTAAYTLQLPNRDQLVFEAGQSFIKDRYKYDYIYGYNTPNDFIKIFKIDLNKIANGQIPNTGISPYMFRYSDREQINLGSVYGKVAYSTLDNSLHLAALLRNDGSSAYPSNHRWFLSPVFSVDYDLKKQLFSTSAAISQFSINGSYGRFGKQIIDDRFAAGPQYVVDMGWADEHNIGSYRGMAGLTRPYLSGWVGYDIPWAYSNKADVGISLGLWEGRVKISADVYNNDDKQQVLLMPAPASSGYKNEFQSGMWVNNKGVEGSLIVQILKSEQGVNWSMNANIGYNKNVLKALPGGAGEVVIGNSKLEVGKSIDSYWIYENEGIYNTDSEVPGNGTAGVLNFNGIPFSAGDARWKDQNGDGIINNDDKVLKGHYLPAISGGFGGALNYRGLSLDFQFYYVLGRKVLNQMAASRLDFINTEANNDINSVKEIFFWQNNLHPENYPMYNPWSSVAPYRLDQDLFLQDASFLKLRSLTLAYEISKIKSLKEAGFKNSAIYFSAANLFTLTPFKSGDPELTMYNGVWNGYGMPMPRYFTIGLKMNF